MLEKVTILPNLNHAGTGKRNAYEQLLTDLPNRWYPLLSSGKYIYLSCTLRKPLPKALM